MPFLKFEARDDRSLKCFIRKTICEVSYIILRNGIKYIMLINILPVLNLTVSTKVIYVIFVTFFFGITSYIQILLQNITLHELQRVLSLDFS